MRETLAGEVGLHATLAVAEEILRPQAPETAGEPSGIRRTGGHPLAMGVLQRHALWDGHPPRFPTPTGSGLTWKLGGGIARYTD